MLKKQHVAIIDYGSQYTHLISNRIRNLGIYSEIYQDNQIKELLESKIFIKGIILSGSPSYVSDENSPKLNPEILY